MKKHILLNSLLAIGILTIFSNCSHEPNNKAEAITEQERLEVNTITTLSHDEGIQQLTMYCYACHSPSSPSHDEMLAPPLAGIKHKYQNFYPDRNEFIIKMTDFVSNPTEENAVMRGPVRRFGLMPKTAVQTKEEIMAIVAFIYDNPLDVPEWFPNHFEEQHGEAWND